MAESYSPSEPEFDSDFHNILAYYACYMIASSGASADESQANHFSAMYEEMLDQMYRKKNLRQVEYPKKPRDNRIWRR